MNRESFNYIIGIDEVGRGPLAGPVTVCAFLVSIKNHDLVLEKLTGITDSKKLSPSLREYYFEIIQELKRNSLCNYFVSHVSAAVIDQQGIVFAINTALHRSIKKLHKDSKDCYVYLDGGLYAPKDYAQETIIRGDSKIWHISAASVIAKVVRDRKMINYAVKYPEYGFEKHKGYGTQYHRDAIIESGPTDIHRKTWIKTC